MKFLRERIERSPKPALIAGKILLVAGSILVLAAVFARAALMNLNAERATNKLAPVLTLAEAYPQHPTWMVPETAVGYAIAAVLVLAGTLLASAAADALKRRQGQAKPW
jgi:hypothetical protein